MIRNYRQYPVRAIFLWSLLGLGVTLLFVLLNVGKDVYTEALWFKSVGYQPVYAKIIMTRLWLFLGGAAVFLAAFSVNAVVSLRLSRQHEPSMLPPETIMLIRGLTKLAIIFAAVIFAALFGSVASEQWENILRYRNAVPFINTEGAAVTDPLYGRNPAFYIFELPLWRSLQTWIVGLVFVLVLEALGIYAAGYSLRGFRLYFGPAVKVHMMGMAALMASLIAWSYWFDIQELVLSTRAMGGAIFGAGAMDVSVMKLALTAMAGITALMGLVAFVGAFRQGFALPIAAFGIWTGASIILLTVIPAAYERFQVQPNQLGRESPYIERNISMTREAYGLRNIKVDLFPVNDGPPPPSAVTNPVLVDNIRLWDDLPLLDTLNQIQFFRPYYTFLNVDFDRYVINNKVRQVSIAAREMTPEKLPGEAQNWVARRLQYTHGYGVAMGPVNEFTTEGRPLFFLKDIPPKGDMPLDRPEIYFGEKTDYYVIVNSKTQEFNYPTQEEGPRFTSYEGKGGIALDSFLRRAAFAWRFADFNLLISDQVSPESRLLFYRQIQGRIHNVTPFLELDSDPYAVVVGGKLLWMQDAFTTSRRFPYSQPYTKGGINYIRNSVKVVVGAYDGSMTYYVMDPKDALVKTYESIFPGLFKPIEDMPTELLNHIRYPADLFTIQETMYRTYHVDDARVFFSREDTWSRPMETYNDRQQPMEPYYVNMPLPRTTKPEFLLLQPFTPFNRPNLIAWIAARNDPGVYGQLVVFTFPRSQQVDGPAQVEARIDNDPIIAQQFSLWGQQGSRIIRGNLLVIPIEGSLLYVEPIYLQAASLAFPELKRVIVAIGPGRPAMEPTLGQALAVALGQQAPTGPTSDTGPFTQPSPKATPAPRPSGQATPVATPDLDQLIAQLEQLLAQIKQLREGQR